MQFPTLQFAVFFAVVLSISWLIRRHRTYQKLFLLAVSYLFYGMVRWELVGIILASSLVFFYTSEAIVRTEDKARRKLWLVTSLVFNLGLLGFFKYYNFFVDSIGDLAQVLGLTSHLPVLEILFPVGISFYVFQGISYSLDLYWKRGTRAGTLLDFLLYMAFFPQLLAGPICRSNQLLPQIMGEAPEKVPDVSRAATLILSGLLKKAVFAHFIDTHLVGAVFDAPDNYTAAALWVGMLGYTMLIYWDFSGYTDLARGLGLLLGFRIPENFNHPYVATDIADFWRRWHITLSNWLTDYLFIPLGGLNLKKRWGAVVLTMVLAGLWHGANWTFVLWGTYHGVLLFLHHGFRSGLKKKWKGGWWGRVGTLVLVMFGWIMFNSPDVGQAWEYLSRMFDFSATGSGFEAIVLPVLALGFILQVAGPWCRRAYIELSERAPWVLRPALWLVTGIIMLALKPGGVAPYIYYGF